jgi:hypothetical protein
MPYVNIRVIAFSGYRGNERPTSLLINDETITVVEILDEWMEEGFSDRVRKRFSIVKTENNQQHKIYIDENTSEWFCEME